MKNKGQTSLFPETNIKNCFDRLVHEAKNLKVFSSIKN